MIDLQHVAFEVSSNSLQKAKRKAVEDFLNRADCYDLNDPDDIWTAKKCIEQAFDLCEQADKITSQMIQLTDRQKAVNELKKRRPGYSDETYKQAIDEAFSRIDS